MTKQTDFAGSGRLSGSGASPSKRPRLILYALAIVLLAVFVVSGSSRSPTGTAKGGPIVPTPQGAPTSAAAATDRPTTKPTRLRLASLNIHSCVNTSDRYDPAGTAALLGGYDLISLHECRGDGPWWKNNPETLGDLVGMQSLFMPTEIWWWRNWFGNGMLTRIKIDSWETTSLPSGHRMAYRQYTVFKVPFGAKTLSVIMTHVGKKSDRAEQFKVVEEKFMSLPEPCILMGDMNTRPYDPLVVDLLAKGVEDPVGQRLTYPRDRVDYIFTRGVKWTDAGLVENTASDHPLVWLEIEGE